MSTQYSRLWFSCQVHWVQVRRRPPQEQTRLHAVLLCADGKCIVDVIAWARCKLLRNLTVYQECALSHNDRERKFWNWHSEGTVSRQTTGLAFHDHYTPDLAYTVRAVTNNVRFPGFVSWPAANSLAVQTAHERHLFFCDNVYIACGSRQFIALLSESDCETRRHSLGEASPLIMAILSDTLRSQPALQSSIAIIQSWMAILSI
jgi:hypothetical protein